MYLQKPLHKWIFIYNKRNDNDFMRINYFNDHHIITQHDSIKMNQQDKQHKKEDNTKETSCIFVL